MTSPADLDARYRAMAADTAREAEAQEWCNAMTREALADVDAGRVVDHSTVQAWADSLDASGPAVRKT
jgi:predicted transcriptional regulator